MLLQCTKYHGGLTRVGEQQIASSSGRKYGLRGLQASQPNFVFWCHKKHKTQKEKKKYTHRQKPTKTNKATRKTICILIQIHRDFFSSDYFIQVSETCCRESNIQYSYKVFDKSETDKKS